MPSFSLPQFSKLSPKIDRAERELRQMESYLTRHREDVGSGEWGALSAVSLGIHNIYNGLEDILMSLARDVDGSVPSGPSLHQDVLDQMAAEISGTRPSLLDQSLYEAMSDLRGFRHLVRHKYGFDLKADRVLENAERIAAVFPALIDAVLALEEEMLRRTD